MCDGPHGLRKQTGSGDHLGLNASVAATCFPTASAAAASWDTGLLREVGEAIGVEALCEGVNIVLGPGVNMKRNPLCGRNFEYYSEDPFLSGKLAAAWIKGAQSKGVGVSLKHFAANNQELKRMSSDSLVDKRSLMEYYLPAFEIAVKEAAPATVMCAYNKLNGVYCSDNRRLLTGILREEWGFDGAVITDWGAMNDRIEGFKAGLDLEMPGSKSRFDAEVKEAVKKGSLDESLVDASVLRLLALIKKTYTEKPALPPDNPEDVKERHHDLARKIAVASGVLLKNEDNLLPLSSGGKITVIGMLAEKPRYQGTGSSMVNPTKIENLLDGIEKYTSKINYFPGYRMEDIEDDALLHEALEGAERAETVLLSIGLTDIYESEGYDRETLSLPRNQIRLLHELYKVNRNIVVVLAGGSVVEMPWLEKTRALLHMQLAGQASGSAAADLLFGAANPSGKLTETYPRKYEDVINSSYYDKIKKQAPYYESIYSGYRYFDTADKDVLFPFGFGLSYTNFEYDNLEIRNFKSYDLDISFTIKNRGQFDGAEAAQLYVRPETGGVYRPRHELKGFVKVFLKAGEEKRITLRLVKQSFAFYHTEKKTWEVEAGDYTIEVGASSRDIRLRQSITLDGIAAQKSACDPWYYTLDRAPGKKEFISIYGDYKETYSPQKGTYNLESSILEMKDASLLCRMIFKGMESAVAKIAGGKVDYRNPQFRMLMASSADNPIKANMLFSPDTMTAPFVQFVLDSANGHFWRGLVRFLRSRKKDNFLEAKLC
ncbi:glycosyl hydrolase [Spirochaetia bacterium]|nr:glycosyl hydrolase [Spirochaetia bacterium]